jgi:gluconate kinase
VLVAGVPGAGKSTLIAGLRERPGTVVLDSDDHRAALARRFPRLPYRRYRWLVHLRHRLAAIRAALSGAPTVVVHLPATSAALRGTVALLAALTGRAAHLLWLHVDPAEALRGQHDRGRLVPSGSFAGHVRRAAAATEVLRSGRSTGWRTVTVADRAAARAGLVLDSRLPSPPGIPSRVAGLIGFGRTRR